jgi:hypothetical protein
LLIEYEKIFKVIFDNQTDITASIKAELDNTQVFDQHVLFVSDMVTSCKAALDVYAESEKASL